MERTASSQFSSLIRFAQSFHLYSRYEIAKELKAPLLFGRDFGDAITLANAKEDYLSHKKAYEKRDKSHDTPPSEIVINKAEMPYGGIMHFEEDTPSGDHSIALKIEIFASHKKLADFAGKDYLTDISPEHLYIIFPDLTFVIPIQSLIEMAWEDIRDELQENELLEKDIAHLAGEMVSLDELRKKLKDNVKSDRELMELRKKMYAFAYTIHESFNGNIKGYEK